MAMAWKEAKEFYDSLRNYPPFVLKNELLSQRFQQGEFVINEYPYFGSYSISYPDDELFGMFIKEKMLKFDKETYDKVRAFADKRELKIDCPYKAHDLITFYRPVFIRTHLGKKLLAILDDYGFAATDPQLFEDIGKVIYGLDPNTKTIGQTEKES